MKSLTCRRSFFCLAVVIVTSAPFLALDAAVVAQDLPKDPKELMLLAYSSNGLEGPTAQPWHMKVSFMLFDETGATTDEGTIEEFWGSPRQSKTVYASKAHSLTLYRTGAGVLRAGAINSESDLLEKVEREYTRPINLAESTIRKNKFVLQRSNLSGQTLQCLTDKDLQSEGLAGVTYCLDMDLPIIRTANQLDDLRQFVHSKAVLFQGRYVAADLQVVNGRNAILTAHLDLIEQLQATNAKEFEPPQDAVLTRPVFLLHASESKHLLNKHVQPQYPAAAFTAGMYGTVILQAHIGTDGRVSSLFTVSGPETLRKSAFDSVRNWTYRPYVDPEDGQPAEVITTINVSFPKP